mmetsp:Transcript_31757/g.105204  ORF Transcript_31757/g.105204 Transcript_31757/m.105204 type:complete len:398 (-) Transcript_31757:537-1730(-)
MAKPLPPRPEAPNPDDERDTDLTYFHYLALPTDFDNWPKDRFEFIRHLPEDGGAVEQHHDTVKRALDGTPGTVVIKRCPMAVVKECRERPATDRGGKGGMEDPLVELGILRLMDVPPAPPYVMGLLGSFHDVTHIMIVTAFRGQDLFATLKQMLQQRSRWEEDHELHVMCQFLLGLRYLHECNIAHLDISLENLLYDQETARVCIMDYGLSALCTTGDGREFRYFRMSGKRVYKPPEMYSPNGRCENLKVFRPDGEAGTVVQLDPEQNSGFMCEVRLPEDTPGTKCMVRTAGYRARPADMFAVGVVLWYLHFIKEPWKQAICSDTQFNRLRLKGFFVFLGPKVVGQPTVGLLQGLLQVNPALRLIVQQALALAVLPAPAPAAGPPGAQGAGGAEVGA